MKNSNNAKKNVLAVAIQHSWLFLLHSDNRPSQMSVKPGWAYSICAVNGLLVLLHVETSALITPFNFAACPSTSEIIRSMSACCWTISAKIRRWRMTTCYSSSNKTKKPSPTIRTRCGVYQYDDSALTKHNFRNVCKRLSLPSFADSKSFTM